MSRDGSISEIKAARTLPGPLVFKPITEAVNHVMEPLRHPFDPFVGVIGRIMCVIGYIVLIGLKRVG